MRQKIDFTTSIDANGWTVENYGGYRKYFKAFVIPNQTISSGAGLILTGNNLPVGMSTIGTAHVEYSLMFAAGSPFVISNLDGTTSNTNISIGVSRPSGSFSYTGIAYVTIRK